MKRVVKAAHERRRELLDAARRLFFGKGYERTSVEEIIAEVGVSKGAFYHHFASKESLLEALADRMVTESLAQLPGPGAGASADALAELNAFMSGSRRLKVALAPVLRRTLRVVFLSENLALRHRINAATISRVAPVLAAILERGVREGVLDTPDPLGTAEIVLHIGTVVHDTIARAIEATEQGADEEAVEMLDRRLHLFEVAFNRVLGLDDHAVRLVEPGFARAVLSAAAAAPGEEG